MIANQPYHWHLATAAEMKRLANSNRCKCTCPSCGHRTYKYYVNNNGEMLDESCGKCDRVNSCDYHLPPKQYLTEHPDGKNADDVARRLPPRPSKQPYYLPIDYVKTKREYNDSNILLNYLRSLNWNDEQKVMLETMIQVYGIGTARHGETIFWQIDREYRVRSGKIMTYLPNGHRNKDFFGTWVHSKLEKAGELDTDKGEYVGCLFGEHLISAYNSTPAIAVVESEKTALLASSYFCDWNKRIWVATAGKGNLNYLKLLPAIESGKKVILYPDHDAFEEWSEKAKEIGHGIKVNTWVEKNYNPDLDPDNADIADIIIRKLGKPMTTTEKVIQTLGCDYKRKTLTNLIEGLDLEIKQ